MRDITAVKIESLSVYYKQTPALVNINLSVQQGDFLGIIGPNGGGKTTLLRSILGLVPFSGSINIYGNDFAKNKTAVGYVSQFSNADRLFPITVKEAVLTGRLPAGLSLFHRYLTVDHKEADVLIAKVGLTDCARRDVHELSGGEFQKMLIARALTLHPKLLLLDEPTANVDASSREQIYQLLRELNKDMTIILVTHDLLAVSSHVSSLACLNKTLFYHGEPELNEDMVNSLYGCPVDLIAHGVPHRVLKTHEEGVSNV